MNKHDIFNILAIIACSIMALGVTNIITMNMFLYGVVIGCVLVMAFIAIWDIDNLMNMLDDE